MLDEPTAGVDPAGSREIRDLILDFKKRGITVLLCSHLLEPGAGNLRPHRHPAPRACSSAKGSWRN